jgi:hypothetical protein
MIKDLPESIRLNNLKQPEEQKTYQNDYNACFNHGLTFITAMVSGS